VYTFVSSGQNLIDELVIIMEDTNFTTAQFSLWSTMKAISWAVNSKGSYMYLVVGKLIYMCMRWAVASIYTQLSWVNWFNTHKQQILPHVETHALATWLTTSDIIQSHDNIINYIVTETYQSYKVCHLKRLCNCSTAPLRRYQDTWQGVMQPNASLYQIHLAWLGTKPNMFCTAQDSNWSINYY